jgi:hypothetical protein
MLLICRAANRSATKSGCDLRDAASDAVRLSMFISRRTALKPVLLCSPCVDASKTASVHHARQVLEGLKTEVATVSEIDARRAAAKVDPPVLPAAK